MSTSTPITLSSLTFLSPSVLASLLRTSPSRIAVIDVRDNDYIGGHISGSQHIPVNQLDARMPELLRLNRGKDKVVFHCMLSQQRGPRAALRYARARAEETRKEKDGIREDDEDEEVEKRTQEVCVLEGGFDAWQRQYGRDESLTEGYIKDLWE